MRVPPGMQRAAPLAIVVALLGVAVALRWHAGTPAPGGGPVATDASVATDALAPTDAVPPPASRALIQRGPRPDPRPDILLFTIDTTRADHLSAYGYERPTSPTIAALAARGTRFDRAYAASSWTVPSVASMLTGVIPSRHGVQHGVRLADRIVDQEVLSAELPSLAASLRDAGYRTVGVTSNVHLDALLGFGRGFDHYTSLPSTTVDQVRTAVARHLSELRDGATPYFLWVHLMDPHSPFVPTAPLFDTIRDPSLPRYPSLDGIVVTESMDAVMMRDRIPPQDGWSYAIAAYDSEIAAADAYLGELLAALDDGHLVTVVAADHGEEFHDHAHLGHGHTAFDEVARVPLVVALPDQAPGVARTTVSLVDVLPTLLDVAGAPVPAAASGRSLLPATRGETLEERDAIIETGRLDEVVRAIVRGHVKYGRRVTPRPLEGLFDLDADPREVHNLVETQPELAGTLRADLDRIVEAAAAERPATTTAPVDLSGEVQAQLRALGYGN